MRKTIADKRTALNSEEFRALVREAGLEPARPEWTLEPESHYGLPPSVGAGLAIANPFVSAHVSPLLFSFDADPCVI